MLVLGQILKIRGHWYSPLRYGNNLCTSDKSKAEALSYFYSVFTQEKLPIPTKRTSPYNLISDIDISAHGVHKQLLQLRWLPRVFTNNPRYQAYATEGNLVTLSLRFCSRDSPLRLPI